MIKPSEKQFGLIAIQICIKNISFINLSSYLGTIDRYSNLHTSCGFIYGLSLILNLMDNTYFFPIFIHYKNFLFYFPNVYLCSEYCRVAPSKNIPFHKLYLANWR